MVGGRLNWKNLDTLSLEEGQGASVWSIWAWHSCRGLCSCISGIGSGYGGHTQNGIHTYSYMEHSRVSRIVIVLNEHNWVSLNKKIKILANSVCKLCFKTWLLYEVGRCNSHRKEYTDFQQSQNCSLRSIFFFRPRVFIILFVQYDSVICRPSDHTVGIGPRPSIDPGTGGLEARTITTRPPHLRS